MRARLTALSELSDEKVFLRPSKRKSLNEAINGLESSYLLFTNHLFTINSKLVRIHQDYLYLSQDEESKKAQTDLIEAKRRELESMVEAIGSKRLVFYKSIDQSLVAIAKMEQELDEYVYLHKDEVRDIGVQVDLLEVEESADVDNLMAKITYYELFYKVFSIYGRNLVCDEDLTNLYDKKFTIKLKDVLNYSDGEIVKGATFLEIECYVKRVIETLERLIDSETSIKDMPQSIKTLIGINSALDEMRNAITNIFDIDQHEEDEERAWRILTSRKLLSLLFAFEREDGLKKFFNNFPVETASIQDVNLHEDFYKWAPFISLEAVYSIKGYNKVAGIDNVLDDKWYELYRVYKAYINPESMIFPEGITHINCNYIKQRLALSSGPLGKTEKYVKVLKRAMSIQTVRFPSTLKSIHGPLFSRLKDLDIELNWRLCEIGDDVFKDAEIDRISISADAKNSMLSRFYSILDTATVDVVRLRNYDSEAGISPSFIIGFFKAKYNKSKYTGYRVIGEGEYLLERIATPEFKTLEICCGETTIKFSADCLNFLIENVRVRLNSTFNQSADIVYDEASLIARNLTCQINEKLSIEPKSGFNKCNK